MSTVVEIEKNSIKTWKNLKFSIAQGGWEESMGTIEAALQEAKTSLKESTKHCDCTSEAVREMHAQVGISLISSIPDLFMLFLYVYNVM